MKRLALIAATIAAAVAASQPASADTPAPVAYVGCSVSELSVLGYHAVGGSRLWPSSSKYDSGLLSTWAGPITSRYWTTFDNFNRLYPGASAVWWELCIQTGQTIEQVRHDAAIVLDRIHARLPGVPVYVSAIDEFPDHVCATTGVDGIQLAEDEAGELAVAGATNAGPVMPALTMNLVYLGMPCHPNARGQRLAGSTLLGFFG